MSAAADRISNFGFLIKDIGRLYTKFFEVEAAHLGITLADAKVLSSLSRNAGTTQIQLAESTGVEPMSLVRILDRMEADDWIERRPHPTDRRARQLYIKDKAKSTLDHIWKLSAQIRSQVFAGFTAEERSLLISLLERAHRQLLQTKCEYQGKTSQRDAQAAKSGTRRKQPKRQLGKPTGAGRAKSRSRQRAIP